MWRCVVCDFYFFSLVMGTKEKGMSLPYQALAAADTAYSRTRVLWLWGCCFVKIKVWPES